MRNSSLWNNVVFEKEVIFHEVDFETSDLELEVSKSTIWTHTTSCDKGVFFLSLLSRKFDDRLSSNFHRFVRPILCICLDTPTLKASLWQLPIVSTVFNIAVLAAHVLQELNLSQLMKLICCQSVSAKLLRA